MESESETKLSKNNIIVHFHDILFSAANMCQKKKQNFKLFKPLGNSFHLDHVTLRDILLSLGKLISSRSLYSTFQQLIDMKTCSRSMEMHLSHSDNCVSCNTSCMNLKLVEVQLVFRQTVCRLQGRPPHNFNCPTRQGCLISPADKRL